MFVLTVIFYLFKYEYQTNLDFSTKVDINSCLFWFCRSNAGGGMFVSSNNQLNIIDSHFVSCIASGYFATMSGARRGAGGAFFYLGPNCYCRNICALNCSAPNGLGAVYIQVPNTMGNNVHYNNSNMADCSASSHTGLLDYGNIILKEYNASRNYTPSETSAMHFGCYVQNYEASFCTIALNRGNTIYGGSTSTSGFKNTLYTNFYNNTAGLGVVQYWEKQQQAVRCYFVKNTGNTDYSWGPSISNLQYVDCYFDIYTGNLNRISCFVDPLIGTTHIPKNSQCFNSILPTRSEGRIHISFMLFINFLTL